MIYEKIRKEENNFNQEKKTLYNNHISRSFSQFENVGLNRDWRELEG